MTDKSQVDEKTRAKIDHFARNREWRLMQVRPDDYLIVVGKDDVYAIKRAT